MRRCRSQGLTSPSDFLATNATIGPYPKLAPTIRAGYRIQMRFRRNRQRPWRPNRRGLLARGRAFEAPIRAHGRAKVKSTIKMLGIAFAASTALATAAQAQREGYGSDGRRTTHAAGARRASRSRKRRRRAARTVTIGDRKIKISAALRQGLSGARRRGRRQRHCEHSGEGRCRTCRRADRRRAFSGVSGAAEGRGRREERCRDRHGARGADRVRVCCRRISSATLYLNLGKTRYNQKQYPQAIAAFEKVSAARARQSGAISLAGASALGGGNPAEAVATLRQVDRPAERERREGAGGPVQARHLSSRTRRSCRSLRRSAGSGQRPIRRPATGAMRSASIATSTMSTMPATLDLLRLARAAKALKGDGDYDRYAYLALTQGLSGRSQGGPRRGRRGRASSTSSKTPFKEEMAQAKAKSAGEAATLDAAATRACSAPTAKAALTDRRPALRLRPICEGGRPLSRRAQEAGRRCRA